MEISRALRTIPLFKGFSDPQYQELATIVSLREAGRGQTIFAEEDPGVGFFVILAGRVKIYKLSAEGKEQILHVFGPGEPFAEVAVFTGARYPAHAMALEASRLLFFPREAFRDLLGRNPSLAMNMLASLSMRLKQFARMIEDLSLREVPARLAAHLLYLSRQQNDAAALRLEITKGQLASLLGTIPETLSRILARLQKQGLIATEGNVITILDREGIELLASGERLNREG